MALLNTMAGATRAPAICNTPTVEETAKGFVAFARRDQATLTRIATAATSAP